MTRLSSLRLPALLIALLVLSGCGLFGGGAAPVLPTNDPTPELPPGPSVMLLDGAGDMNAGGNAARVYLYPLVTDATFRSTPIQAFWEDPEGILGDDLGGDVRDATVRPGTATELEQVTLNGAAFLGVAADLRTPDGDSWRAVLPASQVRGKAVRVLVTAGGIRVTSQ